MLTIPASVNALFRRDGVRKNFRVHFPNGEYSDLTNADVVKESMKFTESLCSQNVFRFGLAEASVLEFECVGVGNMYGMTIEASIEIDTSSLSAADITAIESDEGDGTLVLASASDIGYGFYRVPLGVFRVEKCPRNHGAMAHRQVVAYSIDEIPTLNFPTGLVWDKIIAKRSALYELAAGTLTLSASDTPSTVAAHGRGLPLYLPSGVPFAVTIRDADDNNASMQYGDYVLPVGNTKPAFIKMSMPDYDAAAYDAFGVAVAAAITSAGYDIRYNQAGTQIYATNEEALRATHPEFFHPSIYYGFAYSAGGVQSFSGPYQAIRSDEYIPIIQSEYNNANYDVGFYVKNNRYGMSENQTCSVQMVAKLSAGTNVALRIYKNGSLNATLSLSADGYLTTLPAVKLYRLSDYNGEYEIQSSGKETALFFEYQTDPVKYFTLAAYSFPSLDLLNFFCGELEKKGQFAKASRQGGLGVLQLDNTSPTAVSRADYSECWWDEYVVSPVGTVLAKFGNDTNGAGVFEIQIGSGASVYDMTDNTSLLSENWTVETVTAMLSGDFATAAAKLGFTPTELTMQGWPWIEAGDALEITAEDGTIVDTYALRIELSGIQNLQMHVISEGGQITGEA